MFRPRYGIIGMVAMPYFLLFELLAPVVEGIGYVVMPLLLFCNRLTADLFLTFFLVSVFYGVFHSTGAVLLEEISFHRYPRPRDLVHLMLMGIAENFGYRQLTVVWRLKAFVDYARGVRTWGTMQRVGWSAPEAQTVSGGVTS